jgi:NADH:ubiquinone oxidoreductase subunit C
MNENYDLEEYDYENDDFEGYELQNINNLFICSFQDDEQDQLSTISVAVYRENLLKLMTFFKLSSSYNATMSVDIVAVDTINTEFRFSLIYILQSPNQNYQIQIITKTNNTLPILSSQEIYSAFN